MNDELIQQLSEKLSRLENTVSALTNQFGAFGQQVASALNATLYSQSVYLGNNKALTFLRNGQKIFVDTRSVDIGTHLLMEGLWEQNYVQAFIGMLKPGDTVLDIGANHGVYSLLAAQAVGGSGKIFAFEPNPNFADLIRSSISVNGLDNIVTLVQAGVAEREQEVDLVLDQNFSGRGHLNTIHDVSQKDIRHRVKCIVLDDHPGLRDVRVDAIKMDIEGAEGLALHGMGKLIERSPRIKIMLEFCSSMLDRYGINAQQVVEFLESRRFMCWSIGNDGKIFPTSWKQVLAEDPYKIRNIIASRYSPNSA